MMDMFAGFEVVRERRVVVSALRVNECASRLGRAAFMRGAQSFHRAPRTALEEARPSEATHRK